MAINSTVKHLAHKHGRLRRMGKELNHQETAIQNAWTKLKEEKESFTTTRSSLESLESNLLENFNVVCKEVQRSTERRAKVKSLEGEKEKFIASIKTLGHESSTLNERIVTDSKKIETLEKDRLTLRLQNNNLQQRLDDFAQADDSAQADKPQTVRQDEVCRQYAAANTWGQVHQDVIQMIGLLPGGSKTQEELRTAIETLIHLYVLEPRTAERLDQYLKSSRTTVGHRCLYNIATRWSPEIPFKVRLATAGLSAVHIAWS